MTTPVNMCAGRLGCATSRLPGVCPGRVEKSCSLSMHKLDLDIQCLCGGRKDGEPEMSPTMILGVVDAVSELA